MNRILPPTHASINARQNFANWLTRKMEERNLTDDALADAIGLDRKTILRYRHCQGVPRLEVVATIYAYFGEKKIDISLLDLGGSDNG